MSLCSWRYTPLFCLTAGAAAYVPLALADNAPVAGEAGHPIVVAQRNDRMALIELVVFLGIEDAPSGWLHAQGAEVVTRYHFRRDEFRLTVKRNGDSLGHLLAEHFRESLGSLLIVLVDRIGVRALAVAPTHIGSALRKHHQGVRILHRQQPKQEL